MSTYMAMNMWKEYQHEMQLENMDHYTRNDTLFIIMLQTQLLICLIISLSFIKQS